MRVWSRKSSRCSQNLLKPFRLKNSAILSKQCTLCPVQVQRLQPEAIASLTLRVVEVVNGRYKQLSEELLTTVRKTESSLKRLKKNRPGDGAEGGGYTRNMLSMSSLERGQGSRL